jgi:uncharacterized repeat protein (TIGR01451 family)
VQPINPNWIDIVIKLDKTVNPEMITRQAGEEVEFTIAVTTDENALNNIFIEDFLPPYFAYKSGSTVITWPGNSSTIEPAITGTPSAGFMLHWGVTPDNIGDLAANSVMTLKFKAIPSAVLMLPPVSTMPAPPVTGGQNLSPRPPSYDYCRSARKDCRDQGRPTG